NSRHVARDPLQERAMAVVGGALARGDILPSGTESAARSARAAMDDLERQLLAGMDTLVTTFHGELQAAGLEEASPATLDAWIWGRLFPGCPWPAGQGVLEQAIAARCR